MKDQRCCQD